MPNLFSTFDPAAIFALPLNWVSSLAVVLFLPPLYWVAPNQPLSVLSSILRALTSEFSSILNKGSSSSIILLPLSLFLFLACNNSLGLSPYVFTASSHMSFTVALALPLWLGHMALAWAKTPIPLLAHLVPLGTPSPLMPLMVVIEIVSSVIRPLTLSVRLAANMVAGHLLLALLANSGSLSAPMISCAVLGALVILGVLECAVSLIQAYVFSVLSTLYSNEVNSPILS